MLTMPKFSRTVIYLCINDQFRLTGGAPLEVYQSTEEAGTRMFTFLGINAISNHSTFIVIIHLLAHYLTSGCFQGSSLGFLLLITLNDSY